MRVTDPHDKTRGAGAHFPDPASQERILSDAHPRLRPEKSRPANPWKIVSRFQKSPARTPRQMWHRRPADECSSPFPQGQAKRYCGTQRLRAAEVSVSTESRVGPIQCGIGVPPMRVCFKPTLDRSAARNMMRPPQARRRMPRFEPRSTGQNDGVARRDAEPQRFRSPLSQGLVQHNVASASRR
jgi:hypothetical protein